MNLCRAHTSPQQRHDVRGRCPIAHRSVLRDSWARQQLVCKSHTCYTRVLSVCRQLLGIAGLELPKQPCTNLEHCTAALQASWAALMLMLPVVVAAGNCCQLPDYLGHVDAVPWLWYFDLHRV